MRQLHLVYEIEKKNRKMRQLGLPSRAFAMTRKLDFARVRVAHRICDRYEHFLFHKFFLHYSKFVKICLQR